MITPEVCLTNGEVSLLLVNLGRVNLEKGKNELQIESIALAPGHDTGFFGIDKLTLRNNSVDVSIAGIVLVWIALDK